MGGVGIRITRKGRGILLAGLSRANYEFCVTALDELLEWLERLPNVRERMPGAQYRFLDAINELEEGIEHSEHCESDAEAAYERRMNTAIEYDLRIGEDVYDEIGEIEAGLREVSRKLADKNESELSVKLGKFLESPVFKIRRSIEKEE